MFHFVPIASCLELCTAEKSLTLSSLHLPVKYLYALIDKIAPAPLRLQAQQYQFCHPLLKERCFIPLNRFCGPLLDFLLYVHVSLVLGGLLDILEFTTSASWNTKNHRMI